ncbi:8412_t:CDS:2, partial [Paraglomus occultum]
EDPEYRNTPLRSPIPLPTAQTCPRLPTNSSHRRGQEAPGSRRNTRDYVSCRRRLEAGGALRGLKINVRPKSEKSDGFIPYLQLDLLSAEKSRLGDAPHELLTAARSKANPYEKTGISIFMNRSATKLAHLDALKRLSELKNDVQSDREFRFADLCGGPGGFSEYLLWRRHTSNQPVRGWGITLAGELDFNIERFHPDARANESLEIFHGGDGTGNICIEQNIREFAKVILEAADGSGVDLVTADGGFRVEGREEMQEELTKQLLLCQTLIMFMILRRNGDFVLKLFDAYTAFTTGLIWILFRCFGRISIIKPLPSRPANSERYLVCQGLQEERPKALIEYLFSVNKPFYEIKRDGTENEFDVMEIVDFDEISSDNEFMEYLNNSHTR